MPPATQEFPLLGPPALSRALKRFAPHPLPPWLLLVNPQNQSMGLFALSNSSHPPQLSLKRHYRVSTSAYGLGEVANSYRTPRGLHRVASKIGGGTLPGTVFRGRKPVGFTWDGLPGGTIVHRILWLSGLQPGFNNGSGIDSFQRCIYIHGFGDETTLGRPASHGCIHMAARDLIPLFDLLPVGTLVWVTPTPWPLIP